MKRGLTTADAERGVQPPTLSRAEWDALWLASITAEQDAHARHTAAQRMLTRNQEGR